MQTKISLPPQMCDQQPLIMQLIGTQHILDGVIRQLLNEDNAIDVGQWALGLLGYVYSEISIVAYMSANGQLIGYRLFDTEFGHEALLSPMPASTDGIVLVSNHPEGNQILTRCDQRNVQILEKHELPLRVFILCDNECISVA